jgi:hypothetical protein
VAMLSATYTEPLVVGRFRVQASACAGNHQPETDSLPERPEVVVLCAERPRILKQETDEAV